MRKGTNPEKKDNPSGDTTFSNLILPLNKP